MASSMLTGDRRWAHARKSGMTVLGKVPKPINLPSQRFENHGLDLNVEIVPKGTLTWGSRPSSAAPNAWGSSTLSSPNTDGSAGSPHHLNGRPSSGGSGTRPSTAGSDKSHEPVSNAWGPNSRPSSASGVLAANQTSMVATRPRSAETRPGSSQLSRFAEHGAENSFAWGATGTMERLGPTSFKNNAFTLSSGDFPTLGAEKNSESHVQQGHSLQGRPASASGRVAAQKERVEHPPSGNETVDSCSDKGNANSWKSDSFHYTGAGVPPNIENWHRDPQQAQPFPNVNMPPHQFDPWRGPPVQNSPGGVWYRGGPTGGPYRPAGPPGSYPVEPFAYYPAQLPARQLPNSHSGPRPGAILGGYPPKNGESYRPHMQPDSYMVPSHPVMPVRPGVYPGPVPYDGYYGPPRASFCNSNERETPIIGMAAHPGVYNHYPNQNAHLDSGNFHARPGGYALPMANEQREMAHKHDTHGGQYKVLLKQHDGWEDNDPEEKKAPSVMTSVPHLVRGHHSGVVTYEDDLAATSIKDECTAFVNSELAGPSSQHANVSPGHSSVSVIANMPEISSKTEAVDNSQMKKLETAAIPAGDSQHYPTKKNATLIEKIEGLNNKARIADGQFEVPFSSREEKAKRFKIVNTKVDHSTEVVHTSVIFPEKALSEKAPSGGIKASSSEVDNSTGVKYPESSGGPSELQASAAGMPDCSEAEPKAHSQINKKAHGLQGRADYRAKLRFNSQDSEEWRKKSPGTGRDISNVATVINADNHPVVHVQDCHASRETSEKQELLHATKVGDEPYMPSSLDSIDYKAQRAKMKEIASQRAKQLQKEEEERIREQKAKALAKLEELNRRALAENTNQVLDCSEPPNDAGYHKPDSMAYPAQKTNFSIGEAIDHTSGSNSDTSVQKSCVNVNKLRESTVVHTNDSGTDKLQESIDSSMVVSLEASKSAPQLVISHNPSLSQRQDVSKTEVTAHKTNSQFYDNNASKQKQMGHRRRQNISQEKNLVEKTVTDGNTGGPKSVDEVVASSAPSGECLPNNPSDLVDPSVQHKKRNNKGSRNKNKLDEASLGSTLPSSAHKEWDLEKTPNEGGKTKSSGSAGISVPVQTSNEAVGGRSSRDAAVTSSNQGLPHATEEGHGKSTNQWKPQLPRRTIKNPQAIRVLDKFNGTDAAVWAPVRSLNKNEPSEEAQSTASEVTNHSSGKDVNDVQNNSKSKRAEMERYVPKPAAKELSQQGNSQQSSPSHCQAASGEMTAKSEISSQVTAESGRVDGSTGVKVGITAETKTGESSKPNKSGRSHASWRQRGSNESSSALQSSHEGSSSSDATKIVQKPYDQQQTSKFDRSPKAQPKYSNDDWNADNSNLIQIPSESNTISAVVKDYGVTNKGRRQPFKGHRVAANNFIPGDGKELQSGTADKIDAQSLSLESSESDGRNASKTDSQNVGEHARPHWQPKSQVYSAHNNRQGNRGGGQRIPSQSGKFDKEFPLQDIECHPLQTLEDYNATTQRTGMAEIRNTRHQEAKREGKTNFPNQDFSSTDELAPGNVEPQYEKPVSSGLCQQGQHHGRFNKGQETTYGGGRGLGQDSVKQNQPGNGDRQKHNSHYEYQRVGSYNKPKDTFQQSSVENEEGHDSSRAAGSRYRERGQSHSRRGGHFYGRNNAAGVRVGETFGSGE